MKVDIKPLDHFLFQNFVEWCIGPDYFPVGSNPDLDRLAAKVRSLHFFLQSEPDHELAMMVWPQYFAEWHCAEWRFFN